MYKLKEACEMLRVSKKTLQRWDKAGKIKCIRTPGNHRLVPESEILKILDFKTYKKAKEQKKEPENKKEVKKIQEKTEPPPTTREGILNSFGSLSMAQRAAFNELLSVAITLRKFTLIELSSRARCPETVTKIFVTRMEKLEHIRHVDQDRFELAAKVTE